MKGMEDRKDTHMCTIVLISCQCIYNSLKLKSSRKDDTPSLGKVKIVDYFQIEIINWLFINREKKYTLLNLFLKSSKEICIFFRPRYTG